MPAPKLELWRAPPGPPCPRPTTPASFRSLLGPPPSRRSKFGIGATELEVGGQSHILIREDDLIGIMPSSNATADGAGGGGAQAGGGARVSRRHACLAAQPWRARTTTMRIAAGARALPCRAAATCLVRHQPAHAPVPFIRAALAGGRGAHGAADSWRHRANGHTTTDPWPPRPPQPPLQTSRSCARWATAC